MYARHIADRELTFDFAEGLLKNNLLIVDRETDSVWSQLHGKAVIGPLEGQPLTVIPSIQATWGFWKARHPDTRLMVLENEEGRPYFYRNRPTGQSSPTKPKAEHDLSALGFGLALGNEAIWVALDALSALENPVPLNLGGSSVRIFHNAQATTGVGRGPERQLTRRRPRVQRGVAGFPPRVEGPLREATISDGGADSGRQPWLTLSAETVFPGKQGR